MGSSSPPKTRPPYQEPHPLIGEALTAIHARLKYRPLRGELQVGVLATTGKRCVCFPFGGREVAWVPLEGGLSYFVVKQECPGTSEGQRAVFYDAASFSSALAELGLPCPVSHLAQRDKRGTGGSSAPAVEVASL